MRLISAATVTYARAFNCARSTFKRARFWRHAPAIGSTFDINVPVAKAPTFWS